VTSAVISKVKVTRSLDTLDRCWPKSRERNVLETLKIGGKVVLLTGNNAHQLKVKVTRPTNAETGSTQYLPNGKAYEHQT